MAQKTPLFSIFAWLGRWANSPTNRFALIVGGLIYVTYGFGHQAWGAPGLVAAALLVGLCLPKYSRISNKVDEKLCWSTAWVTAGRLGRFALQFAFNLAVLGMMAATGAIPEDKLALAGGVVGLAALTTAASQGAQYVALLFSRHGLGEPTSNVQFGLAANVVATAVATFGWPAVANAYTALALMAGSGLFIWGLLSDLRGLVPPTGGIGLYFGTFNPFHRSHLALIRRAIEERRLEKVIIHPTLLTAFHRQALEKGEIQIGKVDCGYEVFEKTAKADPNVDYFPTGDRFLPPLVRRRMIEAAIAEAGLAGKVEVWFLPDVYARDGFTGIFRQIRRRYPKTNFHALHGSDWGGMLVRAICDDSGWHYPFAVRRRDGVSATAIRRGARGLAPAAVEAMLDQLKTQSALEEGMSHA